VGHRLGARRDTGHIGHMGVAGIIGGMLALIICLFAGCGASSGASSRDLGPAAVGSPPLVGASAAAVSIVDFAFNPATLTVSPGTTVVWTNTSPFTPHTVTSDPGAPAAFNGSVDAGETFSFTFAQAGVYHYHCAIHPTMHGTVVVEAPTPMPTAVPSATPTAVPSATPTPTATPGPPHGK